MVDVRAGVDAVDVQLIDLLAQASIDNRSADVSAQVEQIRKANPQLVILVSNARAASEFRSMT